MKKLFLFLMCVALVVFITPTSRDYIMSRVNTVSMALKLRDYQDQFEDIYVERKDEINNIAEEVLNSIDKEALPDIQQLYEEKDFDTLSKYLKVVDDFIEENIDMDNLQEFDLNSITDKNKLTELESQLKSITDASTP